MNMPAQGGSGPIPDMSITEYVFAGLPAEPSEVVLIDGPSGREMTAGAFRTAVERLAGVLTAAGHGAGQVTCLMAPNSPDYAVVFHAVAWAGGTISTANPTYTAPELNHQLKDSGASLLITIPAFLDTARAAAEGTGVRRIAVIGGEGEEGLSRLDGPPLSRQVPVDLDRHVVVLPYSSGTTGLPKGVMLSHRNLVVNVIQADGLMQLRPRERTLAFLPYFHIYGMQVLMNLYLARGGVQITLPRFDLESALRIMQEHRTFRLFVAPPVVLALAKHPMVDQFDLSALKVILSAAAPLGAELAQACAERLGVEVIQGYGMTELSPITHANPVGRGKPGSVGIAAPMTEVRAVDPETGRVLGPGETGEIVVRGPQVMIGYLNRPDATAAMIDADGWLHTGDLGYIDADGYLYVVDRVKELIKVKGFQVAPAELEALIVAHPAVADVAVVGEPDDEAGERPVAHVVRAPGTAVTEAEVMEFLAGKVASYKRLARVEFRDAIPKSASGKILRRMLRRTA